MTERIDRMALSADAPSPFHLPDEAPSLGLYQPRVMLREIGAWLRTSAGKPVATGTLNNYLYGRREMPPQMRRLLAKQLCKHARRVWHAAARLENSGK